ncbi:RNA pseudouridine synthase [Nonlabens spongiae]|uniref:RNA pseudouridine synthase n=1 Tax=Nonlabens spongiae TaxID=331648 RepID=A0A1W6MHY8_9FLAO|nr:RluA family pseudouridine synthase [Nonlabens spongiae]ARN77228.1 RNA pseudouridine synthase [Nonlabens spongiae]
MLLHSFSTDVSQIPLPEKFTFPFYYEPHELARRAANELQQYLDSLENWFFDLKLGPEDYAHPLGKMFGVLVVRAQNGELGYLCAFSGVRTGKQEDNFFVPLVFDPFHENSLYAQKLKDLEHLTSTIENMEVDSKLVKLKRKTETREALNLEKLKNEKKRQAEKKKQRKTLRNKQEPLLSEFAFKKLKEEHHQASLASKFLLKEYQIYLKAQTHNDRLKIENWENEISKLKNKRKELSKHLQEWIFSNYRFLNARGETTNALELFKNRPPYIPPSGTGDCAAPKLLQYAYQNQLEPIAMAEFWYGEPLPSQVRKHGQFYPACRSKCEPVLGFMLQGLEVEENPLLQSQSVDLNLEIIYEDDHVFAVNKPAELLSVRGKEISDSVQERLERRFPDATGPLLVHRLDMSTSGILLCAKDIETYKKLQKQFTNRSISKRYVALLDGIVKEKEGFIDLPLRLDLDNRPFQLVDHQKGKSARTRYEVLKIQNGKTCIAFYPITGRTHQLRVHAAHKDGLNCPIIGDDLYGKRADRLHLHAEQLVFEHPVTKEEIHLKVEAPF